MFQPAVFTSYSEMRAIGRLLACCSAAISMAVMLGGALLPFLSQPGQLPSGFSWFANQLSNARNSDVSCLNKEELAPASRQSLGERTGPAIKSGPEVSDPIGTVISMTADVSPDVSGSPDASVPPTNSPRHLDTAVQSRGSSGVTIDWLFDKPGGKSVLALSDFGNGVVVTGLSIDGINMSDLPLTQIRAIVKPDKSSDRIELILSLPEQRSSGGTVPPGTRFSLVYRLPEHPNGVPIDAFLAKIGGMVFTFKYTLGGKQRTLITHLPEATIKGQVASG